MFGRWVSRTHCALTVVRELLENRFSSSTMYIPRIKLRFSALTPAFTHWPSLHFLLWHVHNKMKSIEGIFPSLFFVMLCFLNSSHLDWDEVISYSFVYISLMIVMLSTFVYFCYGYLCFGSLIKKKIISYSNSLTFPFIFSSATSIVLDLISGLIDWSISECDCYLHVNLTQVESFGRGNLT